MSGFVDGVDVVCPECFKHTVVTERDRACGHCGERVPDARVEQEEPVVGRVPWRGEDW